ncbi:LysR family transcriptional regulator [Photobacterium aphoticum]|uniref:LysR family transcriptional regulator n=1 Tax=Photobacterium aphoticum TaxID=754436 RepID=A0A0J1GUI2_9GAMM|nr:LysR family transcriptional regulator [Photobacterium aphoticum]KLV03094.1 LysR family transcriptional regulator [Photobacterium aphoticum]PSU58026.1 LysR family transcriptional regulator [Photobacterium aphoticum]GHA52109.1 LysR family transcriptional regulator [Photobacterium aphoticum]
MKISQLEMLIETGACGSIAEAARKLGKSRTTVSAALSALEDELGVALLERSGNQVQLTDIGESIKNDCERIAMIAGDIHAKCTQHHQGVESALRIARDDALPEPFWRQLVHDMRVQFPNTSVSVYMAPPPELDEMVELDMVDVAYCLLPNTDSLPHNYHSKLGQIRMMSVAHSKHPLSQLSKVVSADLARYTEFALAAIDDEGLKAVSPASSNYIALPFYEHLRNAVLDGIGWSNVPSVLINNYLRDGTVKVLNHYQAMKWQPYGVIHSKNRPQGILTQWLAAQLEAYLDDESH